MKILYFLIIFFISVSIKASPLVNATWLSKNLYKENIKLNEVGLSHNSFLVEHIKCSQFTNFYKDGWRQIDNNNVAMQLPNVGILTSILKKIGISENDHVILYTKKNSDYYAMAESTAIYFTFKYLGHKKISILDRGYQTLKKILIY